MKCPVCGFKIENLPCHHCEEVSLNHEQEFASLVKEFSLERGEPKTDSSRASLDSALDSIHKRLAKERFNMTVGYKFQDLLRSEAWWYIPYRWIGCNGFIVNSDGYVNWLGSALSLRHYFWGHERGIFHDQVDFTFAPDTDRKLAARLLGRFKHMRPDATGVVPDPPVWYQGKEIDSALSDQFPTFRNHFVWYGIPEILKALEKEGLRFTCSLTKQAQ